jgi:hypothetical protein|tara:strand:- start:22 stop:1098 length:1077 start_codon:yes stop_codon:yes gene_type:complete
MALFSNKIETAKFVDRKEKTIEVLYKQTPESETLSTYILELDYSNQDFLDLLDELTIEEIQDNTKNYYDNMRNAMNLSVEEKAKVYFAEWVKVAQKELDKQDQERYAIFEKYKEEQLAILQGEVDEQVERRVQEGYDGVQAVIDQQYEKVEVYKEEQVRIWQSEIDVQVEERYKEVETYKEEQLKILQAEVDEQVERRVSEGFADVDAYREKQLSVLQAELDQQVEQRYKDADKYKEEQLETLQVEVDAQIENRYKQADQYLEEQKDYQQTQMEEIKDDLLSKYRLAPKNLKITPDKVADYMVNNFKDEDLVFKTKLAIFNLPEVKNNKDREVKMKVRKAKTIPELFKVYDDIQCNHS